MSLKNLSIKGVLAIGLITLLTGCMNKEVVPIDSSSSQDLTNKTFTFVKREGPVEPIVMTPGKAMTMGLFGAVGGAAVGAYDSNSVNKYLIKTPEYHLNKYLSGDLEKKYNIKYLSKDIITDKTDLEDLVKEYNHVDYIIDNKNVRWMAIYHPMHWDSYQVFYTSELQFIDVKNKKVIARSFCDYEQEYSENSPSYDELFANDGKILKQITKQAVDNCAKKYLQEVF